MRPLALAPDDSTREDYYLDADRLLAGNPKQSVWNAYRDAGGKFFAGIWQGEPGRWRVRYTEEEYCEVLAGASVITDAAGTSRTVRAGDRFVIPAGFTGTWEVLETTRKVYVIYEKGGSAGEQGE
jgi:uncharacterized cupin superfamily protein